VRESDESDSAPGSYLQGVGSLCVLFPVSSSICFAVVSLSLFRFFFFFFFFFLYLPVDLSLRRTLAAVVVRVMTYLFVARSLLLLFVS
jgi:hypothetical protein